MTISIHYRGQLASAMGLESEVADIEQGSSVCSILQDLAGRAGDAFSEIALDANGVPRRTLLVAIDGEQVTDFGKEITSHVNEITLIPPISGG